MKDVDNWYYSDSVKKHFFHPKNFLNDDPRGREFDTVGEIGSVACGDIMKMWIKVDPKTERIRKLKWRTFGCATAIASTSAFSEIVTEKGGMKIDDALKITPQDIIKRLGGLPPRKMHCSVLADQAFKEAIKNYRS
ncbi:MAG: iron-sulfur cluster assembly scaffold protein [Patescibacteria group bacterium]